MHRTQTQPSQFISSAIPRANVLGVGVHAVNLSSAIQVLCAAIDRKAKGYICVTGVHGIMEANRNPAFKRSIDEAMLVVPDGMPTVWVGRSQGYSDMRRVFGPDLMLELCRESVARGYTHFFYGGNVGVADELAVALSNRISGLRVVGTETPPFRALSSEETLTLKRRMENVSPDIVWVGLSTPKQELFMSENLADLNCRLMVGVGAAFDFHTGRLKDSPEWVKLAGLQWFHRLCQEPARLWRRYLLNNSMFIGKMALQWLHGKGENGLSPPK